MHLPFVSAFGIDDNEETHVPGSLPQLEPIELYHQPTGAQAEQVVHNCGFLEEHAWIEAGRAAQTITRNNAEAALALAASIPALRIRPSSMVCGHSSFNVRAPLRLRGHEVFNHWRECQLQLGCHPPRSSSRRASRAHSATNTSRCNRSLLRHSCTAVCRAVRHRAPKGPKHVKARPTEAELTTMVLAPLTDSLYRHRIRSSNLVLNCRNLKRGSRKLRKKRSSKNFKTGKRRQTS